MADQYCDKCGEFLPEGTIKYSVHVQILSDFDGIILYDGDYSTKDETQNDIRATELMDENDLEEEIFQELTFVLCGHCKVKFARDPFNRGTGYSSLNKNLGRLFH